MSANFPQAKKSIKASFLKIEKYDYDYMNEILFICRYLCFQSRKIEKHCMRPEYLLVGIELRTLNRNTLT